MAIIDVTEAAQDRIRDLLDKDGKLDSHALRLKVVGGGCSGLRYERLPRFLAARRKTSPRLSSPSAAARSS